jgi:type IV secretory pathway TraG/TraD family ATPase VirD4
MRAEARMTPTKLLIGQIIVVLVIVLLGIWIATQWAAAALAYQPELGRPWFVAFGRPIFLPWSLFVWWFSFDAYAPKVFDEAGAIAAGSGLVGCAAAIFGSLWRARRRNNLTTYGSARWADAHDIRKAGLLTESGVFLGRTDPRYLRHDGPEHIMAFAPTRSGKGVGLVVPTLLGWSGSAVIHDIKGENWQLTAGWRQRFSHCLLFNPTDARSARYNPLLEVRRGTDEVRDVQNIADILVDPEGALERRNHWEKTSHSLLVGAILHILYAEEDKTLARVASFLSDPQRPFTATLRRMMSTNHLGTTDAPIVHPVIASAAREVLNKSENERSGVLSTAMSFLGLYRDPTVATVTSRCDWRIADLVEGKSPVSLYLVVPPSDISRTKPLTARALLTPGEVMQLPATDELVLVAGTPPIRATKLRYFEDSIFKARVLPPPVLPEGDYADRPAFRPDAWAGIVRGTDARLGAAGDEDRDDVGGGLEQSRHPGQEIDRPLTSDPVTAGPLGLGADDDDVAADQRAMDQARALGTARAVYAIDAADHRPGDLQLDL